MRDRADYIAYLGARRAAYLLCRDWAHAEDLVQTALTEVWRVWWRVSDRPDPCVYRVLANTHASCRSRRWRGEVPTERFADVPDSNDRTSTAETRTVLWTALGRLPPRQRAIVVLPPSGPSKGRPARSQHRLLLRWSEHEPSWWPSEAYGRSSFRPAGADRSNLADDRRADRFSCHEEDELLYVVRSRRP